VKEGGVVGFETLHVRLQGWMPEVFFNVIPYLGRYVYLWSVNLYNKAERIAPLLSSLYSTVIFTSHPVPRKPSTVIHMPHHPQNSADAQSSIWTSCPIYTRRPWGMSVCFRAQTTSTMRQGRQGFCSRNLLRFLQQLLDFEPLIATRKLLHQFPSRRCALLCCFGMCFEAVKLL
jgi:hypothetical protein